MMLLRRTNRNRNNTYPQSSTSAEAAPPPYSTGWMPERTPAPMYRHAMPSGPWPWMDFNEDLAPGRHIQAGRTQDMSWKGYPQSLFQNWTPRHVERSKMLTRCPEFGHCSIHNIDVKDDGFFEIGDVDKYDVSDNNADECWALFRKDRPEGIRVRVLFVDKMTVPVLRMLGTQYNIEPFFFSSSVNWIPSRYQEEIKLGEGDHITITLPFIRAVKCPLSQSETTSIYPPIFKKTHLISRSSIDAQQIIDTQSPLYLRSSQYILMLDLLSIHMIRTKDSSTMISYHSDTDSHRTSAERMSGLLYYIGQSVYWQKIFSKTKDPTFVLVSILWYALYTWDEAFEILYSHINDLESSVITTNEMNLTRELHVIHAHLLFYSTLLEDFSQSVTFVLETPHPGMEGLAGDNQESNLLKRECNNLLSAIKRLEGIRDMHGKRLQNVMHLAFATVNIDDSKQMKQISYLTMIFLPAGFTATVFGMNVKEINSGSYETLAHYAIATLLLTIATVWIVVTFQINSHFHGPGPQKSFWVRLGWPVRALHRKLAKKKKQTDTTTEQSQIQGRDEEKGTGYPV
ncbi:hypothetical protein SERLA73DRAFT_183836 [Serpula lacrymans var. lacrymans S7.3]|uniref:Uncharacterized protein n=2 Tax=Serpula lacrymans var. lacrymans TaxID=341189 RepID=F8Q1X5_SERL3|nr:uncharacterized protein SERLADRAFT_471226 [Serpula lacrymans var. lacrymans S7.9]EGN97186.1 hypothetical protein SERLA73DRAFT_183836 [Serpula lacrymans var. lacrymans S7.3]EGO22794.1 hypothetical protein SERLADRAFT_471226 [Serpula lacrymans var. lacrymans S7.9]